jgi:hypothetical protein
VLELLPKISGQRYCVSVSGFYSVPLMCPPLLEYQAILIAVSFILGLETRQSKYANFVSLQNYFGYSMTKI